METLQFSQTIEDIKKKTTLQSVIESYGISVPNPNKFINCPFHSGDNTPSCKLYNANTSEGKYHCFGCKAHGDLLNFICDYEHKTYGEAISILCKRLGVDPTTRTVSNSLLSSIDNMLKPKKSASIKQFDYLRVAMGARKEFENLKTSLLTPYLIKKRVPHLGTKSSGTKVVIPICDENDNIWNLQYIAANGSKWYIPGGKKNGGMFRLGEESDQYIFLVEGYSTGASVYLASAITTYVCFTTNNLKNVYDLLKEKYETAKIVVAGDNDSNLIGKSHGLDAVYPPDKDTDFNDMDLKYGAEKVRKLLLNKMEVKWNK